MTGWTLLGILTIGIAAYLLFSGFFKTWRLYRGVRVISCPETLQPAAVKVAVFDAAKWYAVSGEADLHLRDCSRWPARAGCDEGCLKQIQASPADCLVHSIVAKWYEGKECHFCGREIGPIVWHDRPPAVVLENGETREWKEIRAEELPRIFAKALPSCWACHMVETFRKEHPDRVIESAYRSVPHHAIPPSADVY